MTTVSSICLGVVLLEQADGPQFQAFWATDRSAEKQAFEQFIDFVIERLERFPDLHVYHYAPYEATAIKRLMGLHATREDEVDRLLRGKVLVDLYTVVRQGLRVGQPNYSIKSIEAFYMRQARDTEVTEGGDSIVAFEQYLETGDRLAAGVDRALQRGRLPLHPPAARMAARPSRRGDRDVRPGDPVAARRPSPGSRTPSSRRSSTRCTPRSPPASPTTPRAGTTISVPAG